MNGIIRKLRSSPFAAFACRKFAFLLVAIFLAMTILFIAVHLMPSDPATIMAAQLGGSPSTLAGASAPVGMDQTRFEILRAIYIEKFGVNKPILDQYIDFWKRFLTMDYGRSFNHWTQSVSYLMMLRLPWTMALVLPVIPIGFVIGNWIGSRAAYRRRKFDKLFYYISVYAAWTPFFWFALILMLVLGIKLGWFPVMGGYSSEWMRPVLDVNWFLDALHHYALPFLSLLGLGIGQWAIGMRAMTIYEMESDYIQYSRQLGFSGGKLRSYMERNAILPNFTSIPMMLNNLIGSTLIVEVVFGYPGIGSLFYDALFVRDYPVIEACFVVTLLIVLVGNYVTDILYGKLDPRIGAGYVGSR